MLQDISEVLQRKPEHRAISASKSWWHTYQRLIFRTFVLGFIGFVGLVVLSTAIWLATWQGDVQFKLGKLFEQGAHLIPQNYTQAFHWYNLSAAKGDRHAQLKLAEMYAQGKGIHQDLTAAFTLYRQMAEQGDVTAQYQLGEMYLAGSGTPRNIESGISWLEKSADQNNAEAAYRLGVIYAQGFGMDADEQNILSDHGVVYSSLKEGVSQDRMRAATWYLKAAILGHADAQSALGEEYFKGQGVRQNDYTAYILESIAASRGSIKAPIFRSQIVTRLTQDQIMAAEPRIEHWQVGQPVIIAE